MADKKELPLALLEVLTKYTDDQHTLSTREITQILENEYDLTLERRTLYANIELLKKYGHNISTWQENGAGYRLQEHQFEKSEVLALCNAIHSSHFISDTESAALIRKLLSTMSRYQKKEDTDKVYLPGKGKSRNRTLMKNITTVSEAIRDNHPVEFTYLHYNDQIRLVPKRDKPYIAEPRYIIFQESRIYMIATSDHHDGFAHYRLDRVADLTVLTETTVSPLSRDMDAYEYARNMYYMFNDETESAVIRCENRILDYVIDIFGTDVRILPADETHFDVHLKGSHQGILLFAQQYLDAAEILEPESLRHEMTDLLSGSLRSYQNPK